MNYVVAKKHPFIGYIAKRQRLEEQACLPGMEPAKQLEFPFPTMEMHKNRYKVFGVVTNIDYTKMTV